MTEKALACKFVSDCNLILIVVNEKLASISHVWVGNGKKKCKKEIKSMWTQQALMLGT